MDSEDSVGHDPDCDVLGYECIVLPNCSYIKWEYCDSRRKETIKCQAL